MDRKLTKAQRLALEYLAGRKWATPSDLGYAIHDTAKRGGYALKAQGAGRLGGTMAWRLMKAGLVRSANSERGGFPAYTITPAGRQALVGEGL